MRGRILAGCVFLFLLPCFGSTIVNTSFVRKHPDGQRSDRPVLLMIQNDKVSRIKCSKVCAECPLCSGFNFEEDTKRCTFLEGFSLANEMSFTYGTVYFEKTGIGPVDCQDLYEHGVTASGVYQIHINSAVRDVYCDMDTSGGGWTVILQRLDGSENFHRHWTDYKTGFGNLNGEFWIGNAWLHDITTNGKRYTLRFDLTSFPGADKYAEYTDFIVGDESSYFAFDVGVYSGTAGDAFVNRGVPFSTYDSDRDLKSYNCADVFGGGWWYTGCGLLAFGTGVYGASPPHVTVGGIDYVKGMYWAPWLGWSEHPNTFAMKIRPA